MKCPYCKESIEKVKVIEGKYFLEPVNDSGWEKRLKKLSVGYLCPKCETIIGINSLS